MKLDVVDETLELLADRALWWPREHTIFVADLHWGKTAAFRRAAVPIPRGTTATDLARLSRLVCETGARRVVVLGDILHAREGRDAETLTALAEWRTRECSVAILLVRGNHDRRAGDPPGELQIECRDAGVVDGPFVLAHKPGTSEHGYVLAGHVHPAVELRGAGRQKAKLACFVFGPGGGILPAFGSFTGTQIVDPAPGERVYAIAGSEVIALR